MNHAGAFLWSQASCIHPPTVQPSALTPGYDPRGEPRRRTFAAGCSLARRARHLSGRWLRGVWYRCTDSAFEVVVAADDPKLRRIAVDDRAVLTVFDTLPPFRGVKVAGRITQESDPTVVREAREAIAPRYLGETRSAAFVESRGPGVVIRLPIAPARAWDLEAALPPTDDQGR
jgi:hypothetical protein